VEPGTHRRRGGRRVLGPHALSCQPARRGRSVTARDGHAAVVRALVRAHADVNARCERTGQTALHLGAFQGHVAVVRALFVGCADRRVRIVYRQTDICLRSV
jgi:ankyrin repeat protein